jgi:hypothetical protein
MKMCIHNHLTHPDTDTAEYIRKFSKKFETDPAARGTLIRAKNLKSKIPCQTPFKGCLRVTVLAEHLGTYLTLLKRKKKSGKPQRI